MTSLQLSLIDKIKHLKNPYLLEEISRLLDIEMQNLEPLKLTPEQKDAIAQGKKDIAEGRKLSNDAANDEINQWLN